MCAAAERDVLGRALRLRVLPARGSKCWWSTTARGASGTTTTFQVPTPLPPYAPATETSAILLHACCAMSGTDVAHRAGPTTRDPRHEKGGAGVGLGKRRGDEERGRGKEDSSGEGEGVVKRPKRSSQPPETMSTAKLH